MAMPTLLGSFKKLSDVQMPIYAHVKEVVDPQGKRAAIEINYMKFLAYNGFYKVRTDCEIYFSIFCLLW